MPIVYALVARGKTVLAEFTNTSGNFPTVTRVLLSKIPPTDSRMSYIYDNFIFHYITSSTITYLCMSDDTSSHRVPFAFLSKVQETWNQEYGTQGLTAIAFSMNDAFSPLLKGLMDRYNNDPGAIDSVSKVKDQIEGVKSVMVENIEKVLERGEKIELLVDKTDRLNQQAFKFEKQSKRLKNVMWWKKVKMYLMFTFLAAVIIFAISAMACGGIDFHGCKSDKRRLM
ncbi:hypothetical protein TrVE_jg7770 [Triparma verrucosa]|uniref:Uncharacterized protein n=2 Tax=Triparma TaxID=722752 RepID=A0A9W7DUZ5_9STRA|nr:hypothetical protein TrST_g2870 [Triparma strigata]GMH93013.1 hypothetical protein TrVE_jg7770 [Triparma verrucosa]